MKSLNPVTRLLIALTLLTAPWMARAEFADTDYLALFTPTLPQGSKPLAMSPCKALEPKPNTFLGGNYQCAEVKIHAGSIELNDRTGPFQITVTLPGNKRYNMSTGPKKKAAEDYGWLDSIHAVDLNGDGQLDYILEFGFHGVGMAATIRTMTFLLSSPTGYSWQTITGLRSPAAKQFFINAQGRASYITTRRAEEAVTRMPTTSDKKRHSFLVFDVLSFSPESRAMGFAQETGFPVWVQLTEKPQNIPTSFVSIPTQQLVTTNPLKFSQGGQMKSLN